MWSKLFGFTRSKRPHRRRPPRPPEKSRSRRRRLQFEELESRVTPTCTVSIVGGVLMAVGDGGDDVIDLYHFEDEGVSVTTLCGQAFDPGEYSEIQISTGEGVNTVNIEATASGKPVTVNGSMGGSNTVIIAPQNKTLSNIQGPVTVGGSIATLNLFDESQPLGQTFTLTSTSVTRVGTAGITYNSGVQNLVVYGGILIGGGCHIYDIESTAQDTTYTIYGGSGWDTYNISPTAKKLVDIQGPLYLYSTGGINTIRLFDQNETSGQTFTLSDGSVARTGSAQINYSNIKAVEIFGGSGNDSFSLLSHAADAKTMIHAGDGDDQLRTSGDLDMTLGEVMFYGDGGANDSLSYGGDPQPDQTYTVTGSTVTRTGSGVIWYSSTEVVSIDDADTGEYPATFNVNGTASGTLVLMQIINAHDDIFNVNSTAAGSTVEIIIPEPTGPATINIAPASGNLQNVQGTVNVMTEGGNITLRLFNQNNPFDGTHTFTSTSVTAYDGTANPTVINFTNTIYPFGFITVIFEGGGTALTNYDILSTIAGTSLSIQGGGSSDVFTLGSSQSLDAIDGPVFIHGGGGGNKIILDDGSRLDSYTISQNSTTVAGLSDFNFTYNGVSIESLVLLTSPMSTVQIDDGLSFEVMVNP